MQLTAALDLGHDGGEQYGGPRLELHQLRYLSLCGSMFFASEANQEPRIVAPRLQSLLLDNVEVIPGHLRLLQSLNQSQPTLNVINLKSFRNLGGIRNISHVVFGTRSCAEPGTWLVPDGIFDFLCDTNPPVWPKLESVVVVGGGLAKIEPKAAPQLVRLAAMRGPSRQLNMLVAMMLRLRRWQALPWNTMLLPASKPRSHVFSPCRVIIGYLVVVVDLTSSFISVKWECFFVCNEKHARRLF